MNVKGLSHIEVVLGFVIFMVAIIFLIASYQPLFGEKKLDQQLIKRLYDGFLKNNSIDIKEYYVLASSGAGLIGIDLGENLSGKGVIVYNTSGIIKTGKSGDIICVEVENIYNDEILKVIISENINEVISFCSDNPDNYSVSTMMEREIVSLEKLKIFNSSYHNEKSKLINSINLPSDINFEYNVDFGSVEYVGKSGEDLRSVNVFSTNRKIEVLNASGWVDVEVDTSFKIW
jgi:hypothetical protein